VYRSAARSGATSVHINDATTGADRTVSNIPDIGDTGPAWLKGGTQFAIGVDSQGPDVLGQAYHATRGSRDQRQPAGSVVVFDSVTDWSPDNRYVIRASDCSIVDAVR